MFTNFSHVLVTKMFTKTLYSTHLRLLSKHMTINRLLISRKLKTSEGLVKTSEELVKIDDKKDINESIAAKVDNELMKEVMVKSGEPMDRLWELNTVYNKKTEYNKNIDFYGSVRRRLDRVFHWFTFQEFDVSIDGFRKNIKHYIQSKQQNIQRYVHKRHAILGPDLAIASFVVGMGGKVRFKHLPNEWSTSLSHFPNKFDSRYKVVAIDGSDLLLRFEGIDNFVDLQSLSELDLSKNVLDDFACDKLGRLFRDSNLWSLDISDNPLITHRGIETLHRIRSLKRLNIRGTEAIKYPFLELLIISFNDLVPECQVIT